MSEENARPTAPKSYWWVLLLPGLEMALVMWLSMTFDDNFGDLWFYNLWLNAVGCVVAAYYWSSKRKPASLALSGCLTSMLLMLVSAVVMFAGCVCVIS